MILFQLANLLYSTLLTSIYVNSPTNSSTSTSTSTTNNSTFHPLLPPAIPLAVRSPYLNIWLKGGYLALNSPEHWTYEKQQIGWTGLIQVDRVTYRFLGLTKDKDIKIANQTSLHFTATSSIFQFEAGGIEFEVRFLSPITPNDLMRLSLPLSYMKVTVDPRFLKKHDVRIYSDISGDISGELLTSGENSEIEWSYDVQYGVAQYQIRRKNELEFEERFEQAEWGAAIYATSLSLKVSTASGPYCKVRTQFAERGKLNGQQDVDYRKNRENVVVFGFAKELSIEDSSAVFTIGHLRTNYIEYVTRKGLVSLKGLWTSHFTSSHLAVVFFLADYDSAAFEALIFDSTLRRDARLVASDSNYSTIVELSTRQAFASFELTDSKEFGTLGFLKEISSNGDCSTVDVIFPLHPIFLYTNPHLIKLLLKPILIYSASGMYPNKWPVHDLGTYPRRHGHNLGDDEPMPLEEAGNILWMVLAYFQLTGDIEFINQYYFLFTQWTTFLISDGLIPDYQLSTDDFAGRLANQSNLAVKSIVGIGAMSNLAQRTGKWTEFIHYRATAKAYAKEWFELAFLEVNSTTLVPHSKLSYKDDKSWGLLYNLFGDRLLNLNLFEEKVYQHQSEFYPTKLERFGVPLDSRHMYTKSDWEMFAAASATSLETRDMFIDSLFAYLEIGKVDAAFPDLYESQTGKFPGNGKDYNIRFISRPVVGGHFSLLALEVMDKVNRVEKDHFNQREKKKHEREGGGGLFFSKDVV